MVTDDQIIEIWAWIMKLWRRSKEQCECTIHKRTGDMAEVCDACSCGCALYEIHQLIKEQSAKEER